MDIDNHRLIKHDDDDERSEGELDTSLTDDDDDDDLPKSTISQPKQTSQSWTNMLTEQNLSSIMSNALADNSEVIHIDDPIAQQSSNPLTYVFPPGTNVDEYFQRKQNELKPKYKATRRVVKKLSNLLNHERNEDLLRVILETIGHRRAFQYAHEAIQLSKTESVRTLGGIYFKMFTNDIDNHLINEIEREQIKRRNQEIQKSKKKKKKKLLPTT
jgi:hypothetical protein